jgi:hypothetical protein
MREREGDYDLLRHYCIQVSTAIALHFTVGATERAIKLPVIKETIVRISKSSFSNLSSGYHRETQEIIITHKNLVC